MKSYLSYIYGLLAVAFVAGCMKIDIQPIDDSAMASLTLTSTDKVVTRADGVPEEDLNENDINSVQCFFYNTEDEILFTAYKNGLTVTDGFVDDLQFEISSADLSKLNETCSVYAIVNMDKQNIPTDKKISTLKKIAISLGGTHAMQNSFVMVGSANNLQNKDNKLTGEIKVKRVAAKVNVILNVASQIQMKDGETTQTWMPHFSAVGTETNAAMSLTFIGDKSSTLAEIEKVKTFDVDNVSFVETDFEGTETATGDKYIVTMAVPFYTYPKDLSDNETITLQLPWKQLKNDGSVARWATYEYQIPLTNTGKALLSNHEYQLTVNVGVLGNLGDIELTPSYVVTDWGTGKINAELSRPKYLSVAQKEVVLKNIEEIAVSYSSSDPVEINVLSNTIEEFEYGTNDKISSGTAVHGDYSVDLDEIQIDENKKETVIVFRHQLQNDRTKTKRYDYNVQTVKVQVSHINNPSIKDEITFIQYPAMYVEIGTSISGSVFVNKNQSTTNESSSNNWAYVGSGSQGMSSNIYKISVGAFDANTSNYMICDPREDYNNNTFTFHAIDDNGAATNTVVTTATDQSGDNTLTGYRATIEDAESANLVSPEFIVASGYGFYQVSWTNMYVETSAKYRCAGYQEAGYPAGRWRIPTPAELEVIGKLCYEGKIDNIFYTGEQYSYMSSNGAFRYNSDGTFSRIGDVDDAGSSIRCVYDTWYWKDKCKKGHEGSFIWAAEGDTDEYDKSKFLESVVK